MGPSLCIALALLTFWSQPGLKASAMCALKLSRRRSTNRMLPERFLATPGFLRPDLLRPADG